MNEFAAKKGDAFASHFDIVRRIETMSGELPYAIKQFKTQVADFCAMDKKLNAMKSKTEKKANERALDRLEAFITEYQSAYKKCEQSYDSIVRALEEIDALYSKLSNYYTADGKRREARRAISDGEKFDNLSRKQLSAIYAKISACSEIALAKEKDNANSSEELSQKAKSEAAREQEARQRREDAAHRFGQNGAQQPRYNAHHQPPYPPYTPGAPFYPPYDYRMPPAYYQPMPSFNIAPISIDVNSAVDSVFDSFTKAFDERVGEYLENLKLPEIQTGGVASGDSEILNKALEDGGFVIEKLSGLFEKIDAMMSSLSELTAKCSELEEKNRALIETIKMATDTERNLARELQGIQATQKVIGVDQLKLAEEQAIVVESQSVAIARQKELSEAESLVSGEIAALLDNANASVENFKASALSQNEIVNAIGEILEANNKLLELQKNLEERQSELTDMQREALLAHKKLARSQKAVNERSGAKPKPRIEKVETESGEPVETVKGELQENEPYAELDNTVSEEKESVDNAPIEDAEVNAASIESSDNEEALV